MCRTIKDLLQKNNEKIVHPAPSIPSNDTFRGLCLPYNRMKWLQRKAQKPKVAKTYVSVTGFSNKFFPASAAQYTGRYWLAPSFISFKQSFLLPKSLCSTLILFVHFQPFCNVRPLFYCIPSWVLHENDFSWILILSLSLITANSSCRDLPLELLSIS